MFSRDIWPQGSAQASRITNQQQERRTGVSLKLKVRDVKVTLVTDFRYRRGDINLDTFSRRQENGCSHILYIVQLKKRNGYSSYRETTERFRA